MTMLATATRGAPGTQGVASLTSLSLDAAIQLEKLGRKEKTDLDAVAEFVNCLKNEYGVPQNADALHLESSPNAVEVFDRALHFLSIQPIRMLDELEKSAWSSIQNVSATMDNPDSSDIEAAKAFCLSVHQALISEMSMFGDDQEAIIRQ